MQTDVDLEKLKYPIGKYVAPVSFQENEVKRFIREIEDLPAFMETIVKSLTTKHLTYSYRPGGWNIKQIIHHIADSHMNFHIRLRLTLTEETPTIKPYDENAWARLIDSNDDDISSSLLILKGVHKRAGNLLAILNENQFSREYFHPEYNKKFNLLWLTSLYAWHGRHHFEQIKTALQYKY